jgi:hypothetical protein
MANQPTPNSPQPPNIGGQPNPAFNQPAGQTADPQAQQLAQRLDQFVQHAQSVQGTPGAVGHPGTIVTHIQSLRTNLTGGNYRAAFHDYRDVTDDLDDLLPGKPPEPVMGAGPQTAGANPFAGFDWKKLLIDLAAFLLSRL